MHALQHNCVARIQVDVPNYLVTAIEKLSLDNGRSNTTKLNFKRIEILFYVFTQNSHSAQ